MAWLLHEAWFPLLICLITASCYQTTSKPEVTSQPPGRLFRIRELGVRKPGPRRRLALQEKGKVFSFAVGKIGNPAQEIQRVHRSLLSDYMDDLWTHIHEFVPRAALYAFPLVLGVILFLCCITVLLD